MMPDSNYLTYVAGPTEHLMATKAIKNVDYNMKNIDTNWVDDVASKGIYFKNRFVKSTSPDYDKTDKAFEQAMERSAEILEAYATFLSYFTFYYLFGGKQIMGAEK